MAAILPPFQRPSSPSNCQFSRFTLQAEAIVRSLEQYIASPQPPTEEVERKVKMIEPARFSVILKNVVQILNSGQNQILAAKIRQAEPGVTDLMLSNLIRSRIADVLTKT
jgi:hypothetical protein